MVNSFEETPGCFVDETIRSRTQPCSVRKKNVNKELYLTYLGMLKVLFSSRSGNAEMFQEWAFKVLFTVQIGSKEDKQIDNE